MFARFARSRRARLLAVLVVATVAISGLAISAAGSSASYYITPEELAKQTVKSTKMWRIGGRVVDGTIVEDRGRPVSFTVVGDQGGRIDIAYRGVKPNLFGPGAFVVIDGRSTGPGKLQATSVVIKHESAFYEASPTPMAKTP